MAVVHACTVVTASYLSQARVLASTFAEHHPDGHLTMVVVDGHLVDGVDLDGVSGPNNAVVTPLQLDVDQDRLVHFAVTHSAFEVAVALKPTALRHVLDTGAPHAVFLDADLAIYGSLNGLASLAEQHGWVLTPHVLDPIPDDGMEPDDRLIVYAGVFNSGVVAVGAGAGTSLLEWWEARCRRSPLRELERLSDQWWTAMLPSLTDVHVARDPGINAAYWNLHERPLSSDGTSRWKVGDVPLRCFHFSGFDPHQPDVLTSFTPTRPRVTLDSQPGLRDLAHAYAEQRRAAERPGDPTGFAWHQVPLGVPVDDAIRRAIIRAEDAGDPHVPDLAAASRGSSTLVDWLEAPPGPARFPRRVELLIDRHPELLTRLLSAAEAPSVGDAVAVALLDLEPSLPTHHVAALAATTAAVLSPGSASARLALLVVSDRPSDESHRIADRLAPALTEAGWDVQVTGFRGEPWSTAPVSGTVVSPAVRAALIVSCLDVPTTGAVAHRLRGHPGDVVHHATLDPVPTPDDLIPTPVAEPEVPMSPSPDRAPLARTVDLTRSAVRRLRPIAGRIKRRVRPLAEPDHRADTYGGGYYGEGRDPLARMGLSGYERYDRDTSNADVAAYVLWRHLPAGSSLDVGCATGFVVEALAEVGVDARGVDVSDWAVEHAALGARGRIQVADLVRGLPHTDGEFELVTVLETLEHLPPETIPAAVAELARVSRSWVVATIPSFGPNRNGPDGWFQVKVRDDRVEHYEALGPDYTGPVPYDDLYCDATGEPIEGHLTIASYAWWEARFADAGMVRVDEVERRIHRDLYRFGMTKYWNLYVLRHEDTPVPVTPIRSDDEAAELERRWGLDRRSPQPDDAELLSGVLDDLSDRGS